MVKGCRGRVAILYPGDREARRNATPENNRFSKVFRALDNLGLRVQPAVYNDDFCGEVRQQLLQVDGVLVWVNPIEGGRDRSILDAMLRDVAASGVFVSAHPDVILKMGTKEVLYRTRDIGWGSDTHLYRSMEEIRRELPSRLAAGEARVLKQYRGNGGDGVWMVALTKNVSTPLPQTETLVRVRHAKRGSLEEVMTLGEFFTLCERYFSSHGGMIDQAYQPRLTEGMIRCYLVHDKVAGYGHQAINALYPAPPGAHAGDAPQPGTRLYHPPSVPEFEPLKRKLEQEWVPAMQKMLDIDTAGLPVLWDADFLLGRKTESGEDSYVLCEINVSSVAPFPESAVPYVAEATIAVTEAAGQSRQR